jgi:hypothetical protein
VGILQGLLDFAEFLVPELLGRLVRNGSPPDAFSNSRFLREPPMSGVLASVSGIVIPPTLVAGHNWTREHFVNRPDIEFLKDQVTGMEIYPWTNAVQVKVGQVRATLWPTGSIVFGVAIFLSGGVQVDANLVPIPPPSTSGIASISGLH